MRVIDKFSDLNSASPPSLMMPPNMGGMGGYRIVQEFGAGGAGSSPEMFKIEAKLTCYYSFSSPEAALLWFSTKNRDEVLSMRVI